MCWLPHKLKWFVVAYTQTGQKIIGKCNNPQNLSCTGVNRSANHVMLRALLSVVLFNLSAICGPKFTNYLETVENAS